MGGCMGASLGGGAGAGGPRGLVPEGGTKRVLLARHGEGHHNVAGQRDVKNYRLWEYQDARLTERGRRQAAALGGHLERSGLVSEVDLVVVTPLSRSIETATTAMGTRGPSVPFVCHEGPREILGPNPCDKRRSLSELRADFPHVDFALVRGGEEDALFDEARREPEEAIARRAWDFLDWLSRRPERTFLVVTHQVFLQVLSQEGCGHLTGDLAAHLQRPFRNCELRSVLIHAAGAGASPADFVSEDSFEERPPPASDV